MIDKYELIKELSFKAIRSGGNGGQNVNKVATCVQLFYNVDLSESISDVERERIRKHLKNRISQDGILTLSCSESRSQAKNKQLVIDKFIALIFDSLKEKKLRIKTKTPNAVKEKRLKAKKIVSEIKSGRRFKLN